MEGRTSPRDVPKGGPTPDAMLAVTRRFLAQLHPGVAWMRPCTLDSALEQDLGLDSLSRVELAVRIERAFAVSLPEQTLAGATTLRDLLTALQQVSEAPSPAAPAVLPAHWSAPDRTVPADAATLVEVLDRHAAAHSDRVHIAFLGDSGETNITYGDLHRRVDTVAGGLQRAGLERWLLAIQRYRGTIAAAAAAQAPVLPIAIRGTRAMLRAGRCFPRHGAMAVTVGSPVFPPASAHDAFAAAVALRDEARAHILAHCGEYEAASG